MACKWQLKLLCCRVALSLIDRWLSRLVARVLRYHFNITEVETNCLQFQWPQTAVINGKNYYRHMQVSVS